MGSQLQSDQPKIECTLLVVTYHPVLPSLACTTRWHQIILQSSERLREIFSIPPLIAFWYPKTLKDLLIHATFTPTVSYVPGNLRCGAGRCKTCPILRTTVTFVSNTMGEHFSINIQTSCKMSNVIYLRECRRCGLQYVGEMGQPLYRRRNGHCFDIVHGRIEESPVTAHFNSISHTEADVTIKVNDNLRRMMLS